MDVRLSSSALRARLMHEMRSLEQAETEAEVEEVGSATPEDESLLQWELVLFGPAASEWEEGIFKLSLEFSDTYPFQPPAIRFVDPGAMFHPNIDRLGRCVPRAWGWRVGMDLIEILRGLQAMLLKPVMKLAVHPESSSGMDQGTGLVRTDCPTTD